MTEATKTIDYYPPFFIRDGYTETAYITATPRAHRAIRFKFRPATITERIELIEATDRIKSSAWKERFVAEQAAARIVEWNITEKGKDGSEQVAPITGDSLMSLRVVKLLNRIFDIVLYGAEFGDHDPERDAESTAEQSAIMAEAVRFGKRMGDAREEHHEKN